MIIAAVVVIVLLVFWAISIYNNIIRASNRCDNAWAAIDTQLQRRNDLIPNLVNTVKGTQLTSLRLLRQSPLLVLQSQTLALLKRRCRLPALFPTL